MKIVKSEPYQEELKAILAHIAKDKVTASRNFYTKLNQSLSTLKTFPYGYRPSIYYNDKNIRDMIFRGYTIVYEVHPTKNIIEILSIFNQNKPSYNLSRRTPDLFILPFYSRGNILPRLFLLFMVKLP